MRWLKYQTKDHIFRIISDIVQKLRFGAHFWVAEQWIVHSAPGIILPSWVQLEINKQATREQNKSEKFFLIEVMLNNLFISPGHRMRDGDDIGEDSHSGRSG